MSAEQEGAGSISEVRAWLDGHINLEQGDLPGGDLPAVPAPTLDRIRVLVELLGDPQNAYPIVHVTGTNGKSSTSRMVAALLAAKGLSVGLYTSPHLTDLEERLVWNGAPIEPAALDEVLASLRALEDLMEERPSYFELVTAAAFAWFADVAVDVAVVEVGLGGAWDATNVGDASVAVVTNIGVDHVEYLGPTRAGIAKEKAGIVKPGSTLVLGETDPELTPIFTEGQAPERVFRRDLDFGVVDNVMAHNGRLLTLTAQGGRYDEVFLPLHGAHQADNAACALSAAEAFFGDDPLEPDVVRAAFADVEVPGRLEVVDRQPVVLLDGAHNAEGARALLRALDEEFAGEERTLVVGMLREKEPHEMLDALRVIDAERVIVCRPPSPRGLDPDVVAAAAKNVGVPTAALEVVDTVAEAVAKALATTPPEGQVVITGSLYTVGAARGALLED